jgi:hypothetical protein
LVLNRCRWSFKHARYLEPMAMSIINFKQSCMELALAKNSKKAKFETILLLIVVAYLQSQTLKIAKKNKWVHSDSNSPK